MDRVVTFLAGINLIALLIGLFRPRWVLPAKLNPSRLRVGLVYGAAVILFGSLAPQPDPAAQEVARQKSETAADEAKRLAAAQDEQAKRDADQLREAEAKRIAAEKAEAEKRDADAKRVEEERKKAEAPTKTLDVPTKDALAKISAWGISLKLGPAGQWTATNEEKAVMLTLDEHNGKLVKFEYGGFMVKNSPNNTQHFMRVRQAMDWLLKNARKEDKDKIITEIANELSQEKPVTYDVEKQSEIRSTYSAAIGLWVFVVEAK